MRRIAVLALVLSVLAACTAPAESGLERSVRDLGGDVDRTNALLEELIREQQRTSEILCTLDDADDGGSFYPGTGIGTKLMQVCN